MPVFSKGFVSFELVKKQGGVIIVRGSDERNIKFDVLQVSPESKVVRVLDLKSQIEKNKASRGGFSGACDVAIMFAKSLLGLIPFDLPCYLDNKTIVVGAIICMSMIIVIRVVHVLGRCLRLFAIILPLLGCLTKNVPEESSFDLGAEMKSLMDKQKSTEKEQKSFFSKMVSSAKAGAITIGSKTEVSGRN